MLKCQAYEFKRCASCKLIDTPYKEGLEMKIEKLRDLFPTSSISKPIESEVIKGYRNKAKFIVAGTLEEPIIGIHSPEDNFKFNELLDCPLHTDAINQLAIEIKNLITEYKLTPYCLNTKQGEFKYLIISEGHKTKELSIRFGMRSSESLPRVEKLFNKLRASHLHLKVCCFEIQSKHAALFSGEEKFLSEDIYISHDFGDINLYSSSSNFFQVNSPVAKKLYERVYEEFKDKSIMTTLDLFCGVGGFAQQALRFSKKVYGIELSDVAIECAKYSVKKNKLSDIEFICDDANNFKEHIKEDLDLIIVNPPRRGIGQNLCQLILEMKPKYLVYSSCNAKSLKSDLETLCLDYEVISTTPVDMFPLTNHLEVLTILKC